MGRVIAIASGKGGVGKTTFASNLGVGLTKRGKKTVVVDMDMGLRNIDVMLGMETGVINHLGDYFEGSLDWMDCLTEDERYPGLSVLAAAQNQEDSLMTEESYAALIRELREAFDMVIIDAPAGIGSYFRLAVTSADATVNPQLLQIYIGESANTGWGAAATATWSCSRTHREATWTG